MRSIVAAVAVLAVVGCGGASANPRSPFTHYDTVQLAGGVYAFVAPDDDSGIVNANTLLVVGDDGALVVDTGQFPSLTRRQVAEIRRLTSQPVRYVVTTHWHGDHQMGNVVYREAFPGVVFVAHDETRRFELRSWPRSLARAKDDAAKAVAQAEQMLHAGTRPDGRPLGDRDRAHLEALVSDMRLYPAEVDAATFVPSGLTFGDHLTLALGRREVRVMHLGRGNTAGDAVVYVPDAKVLATGDLVVAPTPFAFGSYIGEWQRTLDALMAIDATTVLPGHGPVMHDFTYARRVRDALASIQAQVNAAVAAGKTLEETKAAVKLDAVAAGFAAAGDEFRIGGLAGAFVAPAIERAYQEAKGSIPDEE